MCSIFHFEKLCKGYVWLWKVVFCILVSSPSVLKFLLCDSSQLSTSNSFLYQIEDITLMKENSLSGQGQIRGRPLLPCAEEGTVKGKVAISGGLRSYSKRGLKSQPSSWRKGKFIMSSSVRILEAEPTFH